MSTLPACNSSPPAPRAETSRAQISGVLVLEISPSRFDPARALADGPALALDCSRWSLTPRQAETFFALSRPIPDGAGQEFDALPCTIEGRLRAEGREWTFRINAASTAVWIDETQVRRWGCADPACAPLVLTMPAGTDE